MPVVRSIEQQRGGTALVGVDAADPVELPLEALLEHNIHQGRLLEPDRWKTIQFEGRHRIAVRRALTFLARRRRTAAELRTHLSANFTEAETRRAIKRVAELGYLDDGAWARAYLAQPRSRGRGLSMLTRELQAKGIGAQDLESALDTHDETEEAIAAARKRARTLRRLEADVRQRRLYAYMARRGFKHETIKHAVSIVDGETQPTESVLARPR
jgi:regulatory protein